MMRLVPDISDTKEGHMKQTRVDTEELKQATGQALVKLQEAIDLLKPLCVQLPRDERPNIVKPPADFPGAGRSLSRAMVDHPNVGALTGFDPPAVTEDLNNVEALVPLTEKIDELSQMMSDSRLVWLAEAYVPSLAVYGVAKIMAKTNAALEKVVTPLAAIFATRGRRPSSGE
jgi:hypothetical protein